MSKFKVGDTVEIVNDTAPWNGTIATIKSIGVDPEFPYELVIVRPAPLNHYRQVGENIDGWPERNLRHTHDRTAVDAAIEAEFPYRMETFYNDATGNAVVLGADGRLVRILSDGTIDR